MPTSADGVLTAEYDPARALVMLTVDGGMWPSPVASITMVRATVGAASEPVRGLDERTNVAGGWWLGSDPEMPLDAVVTYTVTGYSAVGAVVRTSAVEVPTAGAAWGVWLKAAGRSELTVRASLVSVSPRVTADHGGAYQVVGGDAVAQSSGETAETMQLVVATTTPAQAAALRTLVRRATARTLLVQTGEPQEWESGWWRVSSHELASPAQVRSDVYSRRLHTLTLTRVSAPAGGGGAFAGATYRSVRARYATYADVAAAGTYADIAKGA